MDQREWDYGARLPRDRRVAESWSLDDGPENPDSSQDPPKWQSITDTGSLQPSAEAVAWAQRADQWAEQPNLPERQSGQRDGVQVSRWSEVVPTGNLPADGVGWRTETAEWRATSARWRQTTEWRASSGTHGWRTTTEAWQTGDANGEGLSPPAAPPTGGPLAIGGSQGDSYPSGGAYSGSAPDDQFGGGLQADGSYQTESYSPPGQQPAASGQQSAPAPTPWQAAPPAPWQQPGGAAAWQQGLPSPPPWETPGGSPWQPFGGADDGRHLVREDDRAQWRQSAAGAAGSADPAQPVGRRRAPESSGSGWSSRSEADDWAGYTDTGSMQRFDLPEQQTWADRTETPSWRAESEAPDWRRTESAGWGGAEAPERREQEATGWREPGADTWRDPQAPDRREAGNRRDPQTPGGPETSNWRDSQPSSETGSWRDSQAPGGPETGNWRDPQAPRRELESGSRRDQPATGDADRWRDPQNPRDTDNWRDPQAPRGADSWRDPQALRDAGGRSDPQAPRDAGNWRDPQAPRGADSWRDPHALRDAGGRGDPQAPRDAGNWRDPQAPRRELESGSWRDPQAPSRSEAGGWRESDTPGRRIPEADWRTESGTRGDSPSHRDERDAGPGWRAERGENSSWRDERGEVQGQRATPSWRDAPADAPDWRTESRAGAEAPDWRTANPRDDDRRDEGGRDDWRTRPEDTGVTDWRTQTSTSGWRTDPDPEHDWRTDTRSRAEAPDWRRERDDRREPDSGSWSRGEDPRTDSWRRGSEQEAPKGRRDPDEWRRDEPAADPWAQSATDTGVMPASWQQPSTDTGSWRTPAAEPYSPPRPAAGDEPEQYGRRRPDERYDEPYRRRAEIEAPRRRAEVERPDDDWEDDEDGTRPISPQVWRQEPDPRAERADWRQDPPADPRAVDPRSADPRGGSPRADLRGADPRADPRGADPRGPGPRADPRSADPREADLRADPRSADPRDADPRADPRAAADPRLTEAATAIRPPIDWQQAERDEAARGTGTYRDGNTGDWRRELAASSDLADGESRRYATADFVPFKSPTAGSAAVPAAPPVSAPPRAAAARLDELSTTGTGRWQDPPDTQWPPRGASSYDSAATGSYERRPVSTLPTTSGRQNNLLEPDEDEIEENTGGPLAAVGYTVIWYGVPVVLFVVYLLVFNRGEQTHALSTLTSAAPQFGLSLVLSMLVAVGLRWASGSWKAATVGLAAAVMGGGLATVLTSAITGNSLS